MLLLVALALSERASGFTVDEGSYAIQSEALADGSWDIEWPFRSEDPDGAHFPYHGGRLTDDAEHAYVSHPAWPAALSVVRGVGSEEVGLRLLPLASVLVAAAAAWGLARRLFGDVAAPWALWIVACSPLLPNGLMLWAHAPAAALAGLVALGGLAAWERPRAWGWWPVYAAGLAGLVLLRSEGLLAAAAVVGALALTALVRRDGRAAALAVAGSASTALAFGAEAVWTRAIVDGGSRGLASRASGDPWLSGRVEGAVTVLLDGASSAGPALLSLLAAVLVLAAVVVRRTGGPPAQLLLACAAAATALRYVVAPEEPVAGLVVAWPVALLALLLDRLDGRLRVVLLAAALFTGAVLVTQYADGGGLQWGGRYLAPLLVPLGALAAGGLVARLPSRDERAAVVALLAATALLGLLVTDEVRQGNARAVERVEALGHPAGLVAGEHLARLDWRGWPERCWVAEGDDLEAALGLLERSGALPAAYLGFAPGPLRAAGAEVTTASPGIGEVRRPGTEGLGGCPVSDGANMRSQVVTGR